MNLKRHAVSALILMSWAWSAHAVSLGEMTVTSRPGEPLHATLQIDDVDLVGSDNQPAIVRVAPPATYLREGINWPAQAQDLKLVKDADGSRLTLKVEGTSDLAAQAFPLLIELNVGGHVTVREYKIEPTSTGFAAVGGEARTSAMPADLPAVKTDKAIKREGVSDPERAAALKKRLARKGRFAPNVVRDYVALNGFDSTQPFPISQDMTIWSIAKLYWPVYEGATLEQVVLAFRERSPEAFLKGDLTKLVAGTKLVPASTKEVFSVDPVAAFKLIHGADEAMPMSTKNLVDAQSMSLEAAELVARAQNEARRQGGDAMVIARAGREALEEYRAHVTMHRELQGDVRAGAPMQDGLRYDEPEKAQSETPSPASEGADEPKREAETAKPGATAREASEAPEASEASADEPLPFWREWLSCVLILVAAGIFWRRRKLAAEEKAAEGCAAGACAASQGGSASVTFQKHIAPTSEAQKKAVEATIDACVKNGTTAGAMGAGAQALTDAKIEEARKRREAEAAPAVEGRSGTTNVHGVPTTVSVVFKTPLAGQATGGSALDAHDALDRAAEAKQPWLEPDDEMPPVEPQMTQTKVRDIREIVGDLSLDLDARAGESPSEPEASPEAEAARETPKSPRDRAMEDAIEGKLKLAGSFVGLGALKEAAELLDEVKRKGNERQRERARFLENRIKEGVPH